MVSACGGGGDGPPVFGGAGRDTGGGGSDGGDSDERRCSEFRWQQDAQIAFEAGATELDNDSDGIACEELPDDPQRPVTPGR
jgi:hypothetical protein